MSTNNISKENIEIYLNAFAEEYKKTRKDNDKLKIIIVGGGSILLNYKFRKSTNDIDYSGEMKDAINKAIIKVASQNNLQIDWLNNNFEKSPSYSDKLRNISEPYKEIGDVLQISTVKSEYLIAMKLLSFRFHKHDLSDIAGILWEKEKENQPICKDNIEKAVIELYGGMNILKKEAVNLLNNLYLNHNYEKNYYILEKRETEIIKQQKKVTRDSLRKFEDISEDEVQRKANEKVDKMFEKEDDLLFKKENNKDFK